jgi:hypothetical protein
MLARVWSSFSQGPPITRADGMSVRDIAVIQFPAQKDK